MFHLQKNYSTSALIRLQSLESKRCCIKIEEDDDSMKQNIDTTRFERTTSNAIKAQIRLSHFWSGVSKYYLAVLDAIQKKANKTNRRYLAHLIPTPPFPYI